MKKERGETDLKKLIANMEPVLNKGDYVFVRVLDIETIPREITICEVKEKEGITAVLSKSDADTIGLNYRN